MQSSNLKVMRINLISPYNDINDDNIWWIVQQRNEKDSISKVSKAENVNKRWNKNCLQKKGRFSVGMKRKREGESNRKGWRVKQKHYYAMWMKFVDGTDWLAGWHNHPIFELACFVFMCTLHSTHKGIETRWELKELIIIRCIGCEYQLDSIAKHFTCLMTFCTPSQKSLPSLPMHAFLWACIYACACWKKKWMILLYCWKKTSNENWNSRGFEVSEWLWVSMQEILRERENTFHVSNLSDPAAHVFRIHKE